VGGSAERDGKGEVPLQGPVSTRGRAVRPVDTGLPVGERRRPVDARLALAMLGRESSCHRALALDKAAQELDARLQE